MAAHRIGIIGSGNIGSNLGLHLAKAGYEVFFSSRHPEQLADLAEQAGDLARYGSIEDAADFGMIVAFAFPYGALEDVADLVGDLEQKIIIDINNYYPGRDGEELGEFLAEEELRHSEWTQELFPDASVVKAFNTVYFENLKNEAFKDEGERMAVPFATDDADSKEMIEEMMEDIGFAPVYVGGLIKSEIIEPGGKLYNKKLTPKEAYKILEGYSR